MSTPKPAVGWGIVDCWDDIEPHIYPDRESADEGKDVGQRVIRVALVPLAAARKAGLVTSRKGKR